MPRPRKRTKKNDAPATREPDLANGGQAESVSPTRPSDLLSKAMQVFEQKLIDDEAFRLTLAEYLKLLKDERDSQLTTGASAGSPSKCVAPVKPKKT
jgi:hypothetical protein